MRLSDSKEIRLPQMDSKRGDKGRYEREYAILQVVFSRR